MFGSIYLCNKYIVIWSGSEDSSHVNPYLCAHFFMVIFMNKELIYELINYIESNCSKEEIPVGAFIIDSNGNIVSKAINNRQLSRNVLGHAEIIAIQNAEKIIDDWRLNGYSLIVSLKPCDMCAFVIKEARLDKVYYLLDKNEQVKYDDLYENFIKVEGLSDLEVKYNKLLTDFFVNKR